MIKVTITEDEGTHEVLLNEDHILAVETGEDGRTMIIMLTGMMYKANETFDKVDQLIGEAK